jgi:hypothetical protein
MKQFLALITLATTLSGCALVYTGTVKTPDNGKAIAASKVLEAEYAKLGLEKEDDMPPPAMAGYSTSWFTSSAACTNCSAIWVGDWVNDGTLFIRIVPQPGCNGYARTFGEHMQDFMTNHFQNLEWKLTGRYEPDLFR